MPSPIEDYAMIGDLRTAALVARDGSIDWLCLPDFDSPAVFAALLDTDRAGRWLLAPAGGGRCTRRRYRGDSLVLETEWETGEGTVRVVDCMPTRTDATDLVRVVEGVSGRVAMRGELRMRFDYGRLTPWLRTQDGLLAAVAGPHAVWLRGPVPSTGEDGTATTEFVVPAGERVEFVLTHARSWQPRPAFLAGIDEVAQTEAFWADWSARCHYQGGWQDAVRRSVVTLKGLTYAATGGIAAAATTSLPEEIGGVRNWDYRYCWLRDAVLTLQALISTGYLEEAGAWREWLLRAAAGDPADLRIMYGLDGTHRLPEYELPWLAGYAGSSPVRVGNAASDQFQLDVPGEVLTGLHVARRAGLAPMADAWDLQKAVLDFLEGHWHDQDNGLWEVRGPRRHFVHSKVLAWAGVASAVDAVERHGADGPVDRWRALRDTIHADVCERGYDRDRNTFTQSYGSSGLDAALLLIPQVGFLPWTDPRVIGTVDAVAAELVEDVFVLRYRTDADGGDGLPGTEGAFLACSFWLADALHGTGRRGEARDLFERLLALRNDVGLLAEECDPATGRHLGNTPQAFSHVGLINTARHLSAPPAGGVDLDLGRRG